MLIFACYVIRSGEFDGARDFLAYALAALIVVLIVRERNFVKHRQAELDSEFNLAVEKFIDSFSKNEESTSLAVGIHNHFPWLAFAYSFGLSVGIGIGALILNYSNPISYGGSSIMPLNIALFDLAFGVLMGMLFSSIYFRLLTYNFQIQVDRSSRLISVNRKHKLNPNEFDFLCASLFTTKYSGGGFVGGQSVYVPPSPYGATANNYGQGTSVYVPAQSTGQTVWVQGRELAPGGTSIDTVVGYVVTIVRRIGINDVNQRLSASEKDTYKRLVKFRLSKSMGKQLVDAMNKTRQWCIDVESR